MPRTKKIESAKGSKTTKKVTPKTAKVAVKKSQKQPIKAFFSNLRTNYLHNKNLYVRYLIITVIVVVIGVFAFVEKSWFVVAVVNGQPITSVEFYQNLKTTSGKDVLDQMIRNKLIFQEASKKGINITDKDIDNKLTEIEKQVGGKEQLESALQARNISDQDFRVQVKVQLIVEKILEKQTAVSEKEIDDYIAKNPTDQNVTAKGGPDRAAIKDQLHAQKLNDQYQTWYSNLEKSAKILRF